MSLTIQELHFRNFRNYEELNLCGIEPITIFVGENAVGKTNIIEGIQLLSSLTSFKNQPLEYLIQDGKEESVLQAKTYEKETDRSLDISLRIKKGRRSYQLNGKAKRPSDLQGILPSVIFTPDDLHIIKGSGSIRRNALDSLGCQLSKNHTCIKKDFETTLKQKNQLLKENYSPVLLESLNEVFAKCSAQLTCYRMALIRKINPYIDELYKNLSGSKEKLTVQYIPSWEKDEIVNWSTQEKTDIEEVSPQDAREFLITCLKKNFPQEKIRQHALYGAQADKIDFFLNGKNAVDFASQGQQRSIVLAVKLAEVTLIEEVLQQRPILLLDDVMSELDKNRRDALIACVQDSTQVFITTTNLSYFERSLLSSVKPIQLPITQ